VERNVRTRQPDVYMTAAGTFQIRSRLIAL
jgi:hypothetical protein